MSNTVHVKNISAQTSEKEVQDFFSFCGKIQSISVTPETNEATSNKSATVTFEKDTAAKTALLLDNTQLGPTQVQVTSAASLDQIAGGKATSDDTQGDLAQEDKPRSRIVAEYLAHGYALSDKAIESAIALDQQHGISNRFTKALTDFDSKYKASERVQAVDQKYSISSQADAAWRSLSSYFEKAASTQSGQRLRAFYEQGQKQVLDVHNEARHLAALKSGKDNGLHKVDDKHTQCNCAADSGKCACIPGECACSSCPKNLDEKSSTAAATTATGATSEKTAAPATN